MLGSALFIVLVDALSELWLLLGCQGLSAFGRNEGAFPREFYWETHISMWIWI